MKATFKVIKVEQKTMVLQAQNSSSCGACKASNSCGLGVLSSYFRPKTFQQEAITGTVVGDQLELEMNDKQLLKLAFRVYMLPLLVALALMMLADSYFELLELAVIGVGILGLVLTYMFNLWRINAIKINT